METRRRGENGPASVICMTMRSEDRLIVRALRLDRESRTEPCPLTFDLQRVRWTYILEKARRHRIGPMLYRHLRDDPDVPEPILNDLERLYHSTAYLTARLQTDLREILHAFDGSGIETIVLKGGALVDRVYADAGLRLMTDLDLVVRERQIGRADRRLRALGWRPEEGEPWIVHHLPAYAREGSLGKVELHRYVMYSPLFVRDAEAVWRRAQRVRISEEYAHVLCPEDFLLHLCLHASYGGPRQIRGLDLYSAYDIARMVRHYRNDLDWHAVARRADEHEICDLVYCVLYCAQYICGAPVPTCVIEDLERRMSAVLSPRCLDLQYRMVRGYLKDPVAQAGGLSFRVWPYGRGAADGATSREWLRADIRSVHRPSDLLVLLWGPLCHTARGSRVAAACAGLFHQVLASAYRSRVVRCVARTFYRMRFR